MAARSRKPPASGPMSLAITSMMSPGIRRMSRKTMLVTMKRLGISSSSLLMM